MATRAKPANEPGPDNLRLWEVLGKTDPRHTKGFSRGGGFKGTAVKPMYQNMLLTQLFGPCGIGWGVMKPDFQTVQGDGKELLVYCTVQGWYVDPANPEQIATVFGVGGDKVIAQFTSKVSNDDEAFKKAFTDAIGNAFKFVGVAADVHMGKFDDSKYVQDLTAEFEAGDDLLGKEVDDVLEGIRLCESFEELTKTHRPLVEKYKDLLLEADRGGEAQMLVTTFKARRAKLAPKPEAVEPAEDPTNGSGEQAEA